MHICKEHGRISEILHRSLMMNNDKNEVTGKILDLALEIIFLLTGEDLLRSKKQNEPSADACQSCLSEGSTKDQSPCEERPHPSPAHDETLVPAETPHSAAQEVPVRCEDVAVFFSVEEWEYMERHTERYKDVVTENHQPPVPAGGPVPTKPPESCRSPLMFQKCLEDNRMTTREGQVPAPAPPPKAMLVTCSRSMPTDVTSTLDDQTSHLLTALVPPGEGILLPQCKEEEAPVPISSGERIPTNPPKRFRSPLVSQKCKEEENGMMTREYQAPQGEARLLRACKEEDVPVEIGAGDHHSIKPPNIVGRRGLSQEEKGFPIEETRMIPPESQAVTGVNVLPNRCDEPNHSEIISGPPTSWKIEPDSPNVLIPVHHKNGDKLSILEHNISNDIHPIAVIVKPQTVQSLIPTLNGKTDQPHLLWPEPHGAFCASSSTKYRVEEINLPSVVHECLQCGQSFGTETDLIAHEQCHCALCKQCFMDKSAMAAHHLVVHMTKSNTKVSQSKSATKDKGPYLCNECNKLFVSRSTLKKHQRIHTGSFSCSECGRCLTDKTALIRHLRTHTGEKPFPCTDCGRHFSRKDYLMDHQKKYLGCSRMWKTLDAQKVLHKQDEVSSDTSAAAPLE